MLTLLASNPMAKHASTLAQDVRPMLSKTSLTLYRYPLGCMRGHMKTYTLSAANAFTHKPEHPERTARRSGVGHLNFDVVFKVWNAREPMARTIRMQERRESRQTDWRACVKLTDGEGY